MDKTKEDSFPEDEFLQWIEIAAIDRASRVKGARTHLKDLNKKLRKLCRKKAYSISVESKDAKYHLGWHRDSDWCLEFAQKGHRFRTAWGLRSDADVLIAESLVPKLLNKIFETLTQLPKVEQEGEQEEEQQYVTISHHDDCYQRPATKIDIGPGAFNGS